MFLFFALLRGIVSRHFLYLSDSFVHSSVCSSVLFSPLSFLPSFFFLWVLGLRQWFQFGTIYAIYAYRFVEGAINDTWNHKKSLRFEFKRTHTRFFFRKIRNQRVRNSEFHSFLLKNKRKKRDCIPHYWVHFNSCKMHGFKFFIYLFFLSLLIGNVFSRLFWGIREFFFYLSSILCEARWFVMY